MNIDGDDNVQIKAEGDVVAAIGDGAIAAGGDIIINQGVPLSEHAEILQKNKLLEEKLAKLMNEKEQQLNSVELNNAKEIRTEIAKSVVEIYQQNLNREGVEFSPEKHLQIADIAIMAGELNVAVKNYTKAMEKFAISGNKREYGAMISLGVAYIKQTKLELAEVWLQKALTMCKANDYVEGISAALSNLSIVEQWRKNYDQSSKYLHQALDLAKENGDQRFEGNILGNLGNLANLQGDINKSMDYYKQSKVILEKVGTLLELASLEDNLGFIARLQKDYQKSYDFHMKSYMLRVELEDKVGQLHCIVNLSALALETGNIESGKNLANEALKMARGFNDRMNEGVAMANLAHVAQLEGNNDIANGYISKIRILEKETGIDILREGRKDSE